MRDTTVKKVSSVHSPKGEMGQKYLACGIHLSMRLWENEPAADGKAPTRREYETVGYVISGRAELELEGQTIRLEPGDSCFIPGGMHHNEIATSDDLEILEVSLPGEIGTVAVDPPAPRSSRS